MNTSFFHCNKYNVLIKTAVLLDLPLLAKEFVIDKYKHYYIRLGNVNRGEVCAVVQADREANIEFYQ